MIPNLFVIGASKCGSTFLHDLLKQHPDIFMSEIKELGFFNGNMSDCERAAYLSNFSGIRNFLYAGESTPLYSETTFFQNVPQNIYHFNPSAKIIYIVRSPFKRLKSVYRQALSTGHHLESKYYDAAMPLSYVEAIFLYPPFLEATKYHTHLQNYRRYFSDENIKVVLFEDLVNNTFHVLSEIFNFLGISAEVNIDTFVAEKNSGYNKRIYNPLIDNLNQGFIGTLASTLPVGVKKIVLKLVESVFSPRIKEPELTDTDKAKIHELLYPEVNGIYQYLNITDDPWNFFDHQVPNRDF